jgi:hypothetical protein
MTARNITRLVRERFPRRRISRPEFLNHVGMVRYAVRATFSGARVLPVASRAGTSHCNAPTSLFVKVMIPESFKLQITE